MARGKKHSRPVTAHAEEHGGAAAKSTKGKEKTSHAGAAAARSTSGDRFAHMLGGDAAVTALLRCWEENEPCYVESGLTQFTGLVCAIVYIGTYIYKRCVGCKKRNSL